jgi:hypothetical protein
MRTGSRWRARFVLHAVAAASALAVASAASGSIQAAHNAQRPALEVDARGYAEVSWTEAGVRRTLLIPPAGRYLPGGHISGPDVSKPADTSVVPFAVLVRRTPDGRLWALQEWRTAPRGPRELRFARWRGAPTTVEASVDGDKLSGTAVFQGKGVYGTSPTTAGKAVTHFAFVDCDGCPGTAGWTRLLGLRLEGPRGTFTLRLTPKRQGRRYRVTVPGPNRGWTYAPDATVVVVAR